MNKKSIEDRFSQDIDNYLNGIETIHSFQSQEYNDLLELGKILDKDFSKNSNKEAVFHKTIENMNKNKGEIIMKKSNKFRRPATLVASFAVVCIMGVSIMQSSFAQDLVEKIVQKVSLGHITVTQTESSQTDTLPMPDDLKGKIFDKDGKEIKELNKEKNQKYYTADGEEIVGIANGEIITASQQEKMNKQEESYKLVIKDPNEFNKYTCFKVLLPTYLPKGYELDKGEFYKDEKGNVSKKYIDLYFTNQKTGKYISMQQRFADEETAYETGTDGKIEKVKMNGVDAVISDDRSIDWEMNNVLYRLSGREEITKDELIKIAESMK